jgi:hypothetical protein
LLPPLALQHAISFLNDSANNPSGINKQLIPILSGRQSVSNSN